jgi:hypothetical protein
MRPDHSILIAQREMFRIATDPARGGCSWKVLAAQSGIPEATLHSYRKADAPAAMPISALTKLCGVIAPELLSLLLPDGFALVKLAELNDPAALATGALEYVGLYSAARHPASEAGSDIGPREAAGLSGAATKLREVG